MKTNDLILLGAGFAAGRLSNKMQAGPIGATEKRISVKKYYPIPGRKDFFKYVVMEGDTIAKGYQGNKFQEMFFNEKKDADRVANAKRKLRRKYNS